MEEFNVLQKTMLIASMVVLLVLNCTARADDSQPRKWTDSTGKFTIQATFVKFEGGKVVLRKTDGQEIQRPAIIIGQD